MLFVNYVQQLIKFGFKSQIVIGHNFQNELNFGMFSEKFFGSLISSHQKSVANFVRYSGFISEAASQGCKIAFLPEGFDFIGSNINTTLAQSETIDGPLIEKLKTLAVDKKIWLSLGGFHEKIDETYSDGKR